MRLKNNKDINECHREVTMVGELYYNHYVSNYPQIDFTPVYTHFIDWVNATRSHPGIEPHMAYQQHCTRHGFRDDMVGALAEFISQCNLLSWIGGEVVLELDKEGQIHNAVDYSISGYTIQVKASIINDRLLIDKKMLLSTKAQWVSFVDIDKGIHLVIPTIKLIQMVPYAERKMHIDDLEVVSEAVFDNSHIFKHQL